MDQLTLPPDLEVARGVTGEVALRHDRNDGVRTYLFRFTAGAAA